ETGEVCLKARRQPDMIIVRLNTFKRHTSMISCVLKEFLFIAGGEVVIYGIDEYFASSFVRLAYEQGDAHADTYGVVKDIACFFTTALARCSSVSLQIDVINP